MAKNVDSKEMYLKLYYFFWKKTIRHFVHIKNPRKFNWRNLPMSTSTTMNVDVGRWTRTGTWT